MIENLSSAAKNRLHSWIKTASGLWDLTRSDREPVTTTKTIPCNGQRAQILIEPSRSALVIIDMQSTSLNLKLKEIIS
jgi:hypothetical protein